jgi:hypothetical protein
VNVALPVGDDVVGVADVPVPIRRTRDEGATGFTPLNSDLAASILEHSVEVSHPIGIYGRSPLYSHVHQRVTCSTIQVHQRPPHREGAKNGDHGGQSGGNGCGGGGGIGVGNRFSPSQYFAGALVRTSQSNQ